MSDMKRDIDIETEEKQIADDSAFVRDLFEQDGVEAPEALSAENMKLKLEEVKPGQIENAVCEAGNDSRDFDEKAQDAQSGHSRTTGQKKYVWRKYIGFAAAAAACLLLVMTPVMNSLLTQKKSADSSVPANGLETFSSYSEIEQVLETVTGSYVLDYDIEGENGILMKNGEAADGSTVQEAAPGSSVYSAEKSMQAPGGQRSGHSDTYIQVAGVDEADRVKVDDRYIYFISSSYDRVCIRKADHGKTENASVIKAGKYETFTDLFLKGNKLIVISEVVKSYGSVRTAVTVYDITDRKAPEEESVYIQTGTPVSQRMVGDIVYLVTDQYAYNKEIPVCGTEDSPKKLKPGEIACVPNLTQPEYTVIGAVDTSSGKELSHVTKAVLGGSQDIYANGDNLYVAGTTYISDEDDAAGEKEISSDADSKVVRKWMPFYLYPDREEATMLIKVRMNDGKIKIGKAATVEGTIDDQFSMDERDGTFRIATTSSDVKGREINNLFVLDKDLKTLGSVTGFAKGESIKAVRYVKDKAYVITYEETDPLFIIDLSDSSKPVIEGEVKISGFSTLLVPINEDTMLGIGYSTEDGGDDIGMEVTNGLKFALFDVSDPSKPKVADSKTLKDVYSDVQEDHKALVRIPGENSFLVPGYKEENNSEDSDAETVTDVEEEAGEESEDWEEDVLETDDYYHLSGRVYSVSAKDGKLTVGGKYKTDEAVSRCPVIDGYIYAIREDDKVVSFKL